MEIKSAIIKLQKARRMVRKNGFVSGGKIVGGYLGTYLKSFFVGSGDVLFITGGVGDKAHYRAYGVAEELTYHGFTCSVTMPDNPRLSGLSRNFKIFIFHKVVYTERIRKFIEEIKKQNKEIIFDTDDLDFDPKYFTRVEYFSNISDSEKQEYKNGIGSQILDDPYVKTATASVGYLAEKLKERGKKVFVVPNKISDKELEIAEMIMAKKNKGDNFIRLGYYSGTPSHDKDFATVMPAIKEIMRKRKEAELVLAGPLDTKSALNEFLDRIEILPRVPRAEYYLNIRKCDINLAPLELDNPFCEAKSEIKFLEAGVLGIPTVAVKNRTFSEAITDGENGFLAMTQDEWVAKIDSLIVSEKLRLEMGEKAREKVRRDYTNKNSHGEEYYDYLREVLRKQDDKIIKK